MSEVKKSFSSYSFGKWEAFLSAVFLLNKENRTYIRDLKHFGPLRIQRLFYEGDVAHLYLLHPPGGIVSGDSLLFEFNFGKKTKAVITTPSATKIYQARSNISLQQQKTVVVIKEGAEISFLPQETIVFNNAFAQSIVDIFVKQGSTFFGWDIVVLGRQSSNEEFLEGSYESQINLYIDDVLKFRDSNLFDGSISSKSVAGLNGNSISGTCLCVLKNPDKLSELLSKLRSGLPALTSDILWSVTNFRESIIILRVIGSSLQKVKQLFEFAWLSIFKYFCNGEPVSPRIWST